MLDRPKVMKELQESADKLFINLSHEFNLVHEVWKTIVADPLFAQKVAQVKAPWLIPSWQGKLDQTYLIKPMNQEPYTVIGVDGSQIYPDRHQGTSCCLVNIGSAFLSYGPQHQIVFNSKPFVCLPDQTDQGENPVELINGKRQELEFNEIITIAQTLLTERNKPFLFLFDGSLIFWHLEGKEQSLKDNFINRYISTLHQLYKDKVPLAGYISMPKSKELINLVRLAISQFNPLNNLDYKKVEHLVDTHLAAFFLEPNHRTTLFASKAPITAFYPTHLKPYFYYLNVGDEIVRIEIPAWQAHDEKIINEISSLILDQALKGRGYPVCLAEAHEQAVVKGPDRDFFYHMIQKIGYTHKQHLIVSQKSLKKRAMSI